MLPPAKKMQCQQCRQLESVKIMQFMRLTWPSSNASWQAEGHTGLTKKHTWRQLLRLLRATAGGVGGVATVVAACLIFGNTNLLATYTTRAAMRCFCCWCQRFGVCSLFDRRSAAR